MPVEVRLIDDTEVEAWFRAEAAGFGDAPPTEAQLAVERTVLELDRTVAAVDGGDVVGTASAYSFELTLPGGGLVPAAGVTGVTVRATHRRRGILRRMLADQLDDVAARGEAVAVLNASEAVIYRRFGYGVADFYQELRLERHRAAFAHPVAERRLRMVERLDAGAAVGAIYDDCRLARPGMLSHSEAWWGCVYAEHRSWKGGGDVFVVVCEPEGDDPGGFATWTFAHRDGGMVLQLRHLVAATSATEAALWHFLVHVDLVAEIVAESRPLDDGLRWLLADARRPRVTRVQDYLWVRPLDIEALLAARRYRVADELVLEVADPFHPPTAGRFRLAGGPDGAECVRTDAEPDLVLGVAELGSVSLGGVPVRSLAGAGRVEARTAGAVERADLLFGWPVAPHCTTRF